MQEPGSRKGSPAENATTDRDAPQTSERAGARTDTNTSFPGKAQTTAPGALEGGSGDRGAARADTGESDTQGDTAAETVAVEEGVFVDQARGRSVPWRLYVPVAGSAEPAPVVIFSHGLGGSRNAAPYLGRALAEGGYWGLFIQHQGSDIRLVEAAKGGEEVRQSLLKSLRDPSNMVNRFLDVPFVIDELERMNTETGPFQGRFDLLRIGLAGHSYGARTVLAAAGQAVGPVSAIYKDARVRAGLALSPTGGRGMNDAEVVPPEHYNLIDIPILHVTGTEDRLPLGGGADFDPYIRTLPFQHIPADDQYLIVLHGAEHDDFSATRQGRPAQETRYTMLAAEAALLFFDAYLRGSESAWMNLRNRLAEHLDREDYYEFR